MSVKYTDNTATINADTIKGANLAIRLMLDDIDKNAFYITPKDKGNLRRDIVKSVLGTKGKIVWGKRYAIYQESIQYANYTTPGTGPHYAEKSVKKIVANSEKYFMKAKIVWI